MEKFLAWCGKERATLAKSLLLALLPLTCCVLYCALQGHWIGDVYLANSQWNDELFYYKQVEAILRYGYPQGYFGFNESHALKLSFAAWSPALVFPWVIWGLLFGWSPMSPVICNIFLMSMVCLAYVWLTRPSWKQLGILAALFALYTPLARYMLSGMAEALCFAMLILFYSLAVNYRRRMKDYKLLILILMSCVMTLMRPYLALFMLLPAYFLIRRGKGPLGRWLGALGALLFMGAAFGLYSCINHYLGAEYFAPLFFTEWVDAFFEVSFLGGLRFTLRKLMTQGEEFIAFIKQGIRVGTTTGAVFAGYVGCMCVLLLQSAESYVSSRRQGRKEDPELMAVRIHLAFSFLAMIPALLLMYKLIEGSRHLLTFIAAAVFLIPLAQTRLRVKELCVAMAFAFLYIYRAVDPYDYQVAYMDEERRASMEEWQGVFSQYLTVDEEETPCYENTIIWLYSEEIEDVPIYTTWQLLYGLPEGFGISCCERKYVMKNMGNLKSQYMLGPVGGQIERMCAEAGYGQLYSDGEMALYEIRASSPDM